MEAWQIAASAFAVICGLVGIIYWAGQNRDDKQDARFTTNETNLKEHIREDIRAHERLTAVETKVEHLQSEVGKLRDMRHEIIEQCTRALADWYSKVIEMINKKL
jgi:hypothetical protein